MLTTRIIGPSTDDGNEPGIMLSTWSQVIQCYMKKKMKKEKEKKRKEKVTQCYMEKGSSLFPPANVFKRVMLSKKFNLKKIKTSWTILPF